MKLNLINKYDQENYQDILEKVYKKAWVIQELKNNDSINVILVDNNAIKDYNKNYRNIDKATDVLTFPDGTFGNLGDVIISMDKVKEQATEYEHSFNRELAFLAVHGLLHTIGYDHQTDDEDKEMTDIQNHILNKAKLYR
ncbi:MAG: rRNA maturation RNase YbeY [Candidatus Izemoplasma sp.]